MTMRNSFPTDLAGGLPVLDTRLALATLVARDTAGRPRIGIMPDDVETPLVTGLATMSYRVRDFRAVTSRSGLGVEFCANDGALTVTTTAAPASNSRIDVIYVRPRFLANADGSATPEVGVVQGTAALTPQRPTLPAGALVLASARVSAGATGTSDSRVVITNEAPFTAAAGGILTVRTRAELDAWEPADGDRAQCLADGFQYVRKNGQWGPEMMSGIVSYSPVRANARSDWEWSNVLNHVFPVPFPSGTTPTITSLLAIDGDGLMNVTLSGTPTNTGFTYRVMRLATSLSNGQLHWAARI